MAISIHITLDMLRNRQFFYTLDGLLGYFQFHFFGFGKLCSSKDSPLFIVELQVFPQHLLAAVASDNHDR